MFLQSNITLKWPLSLSRNEMFRHIYANDCNSTIAPRKDTTGPADETTGAYHISFDETGSLEFEVEHYPYTNNILLVIQLKIKLDTKGRL